MKPQYNGLLVKVTDIFPEDYGGEFNFACTWVNSSGDLEEDSFAYDEVEVVFTT